MSSTTYESARDQPPEMSSLDARIESAGGTSTTLELQPHRLQQDKVHDQSGAPQFRELVQQNGHLRQEIAYYRESKNAMMDFHSRTLQAYEIQRSALRELSEKLVLAEQRLEQYWGIPLTGSGKDDLIRF